MCGGINDDFKVANCDSQFGVIVFFCKFAAVFFLIEKILKKYE